MLVTRQKQIPISWLFMIAVPWVFFYFIIIMGGLNFFILNRLIENPVTLTFLLSIPGLIFTFIPLGAYVTYMSDRIWTPWGRRKIFLIIYFAGMAGLYFCYPLAPNISVFVALMFIGSLIGIFGGPFESLKLEIVPPYLRGRSGAINQWISTVINVIFWVAVLGRFDEVLPVLGKQLAGVNVIFWVGSAGGLVLVYLYCFAIKEVKPHSTITGERFTIKKLWGSLTIPQLRYLYIFVVATTMLSAGLGIFGQLLYINQWGFSLQEMGTNVAVGGVINLFLIPIVGIFADKAQRYRMRIWIGCLLVIQVLAVASYLYYTFYLPDQRPSLVEIIFFGETSCIFGILAGMVYYPLVYDYVPRNLMGTYMAGAGILGSITGFLTNIGIGGFMWVWAAMFYPPAGEMVQVALGSPMEQHQVEKLVREAGLKTPEGEPAKPGDITARAWYANGIVSKSGTAFEVRIRDSDGEKKRTRKDKLKNECDLLEAKIREKTKAGRSAASIAKVEARLQTKKSEFNVLDSTLKARAETWSHEVVRGLGDKVIQPGAELIAHAPAQAVVATLPIEFRPEAAKVDKVNRIMRHRDSTFMDLGIVSQGLGFGLNVASLVPPGQDPTALIERTCATVRSVADSTVPEMFGKSPLSVSGTVKPAILLDIALVENPIRTFVSIITRGVNAVLSVFVELPPPDQKVISLGRNLIKGGFITNARALAQPGNNVLHLAVIRGDQGNSDTATAWIDSVVSRTRHECASLRLTVPQAIIEKSVVPIKYNYLTGNFYIFGCVLLGMLGVAYFISREKKGLVRKWGAEEALHEERRHAANEAKKANAVVSGIPHIEEQVVHKTYTPGYLWPKLGGVAIGATVLWFAWHEAWPNLRLLFAGVRSQAVVVSVVMNKPGQDDIVMSTQAELDDQTKAVSTAKDYSWTFYNTFGFTARDGQEVTFTRNVGCKLKPSLPLLDTDGLPTTAMIYYDAKAPSKVMLPLEYSTWLVPVLFTIIGLVMFLMSIALSITALRPIVLVSTEDINLDSHESKPALDSTEGAAAQLGEAVSEQAVPPASSKAGAKPADKA